MKQKRNGWITGFLAACLLMPNIVAAQTSDAIRVVANGTEIAFDQEPMMMQDRVMVPIRAVSEALGCEVRWYGATESIGIGEAGIDRIVMKVGYPRVLELSTNAVVAKVTEIDQPPVIQNDRTLVPIRALAEALQAKVDWDETTRTVTVSSQSVDEKWTFRDGLAIVKMGRYSGVYREDGTQILPMEYDTIVRCGEMLVTTTAHYVTKYHELNVYHQNGTLLLEGGRGNDAFYAFGHLVVSHIDENEPYQSDGSYVRRYSVLDAQGNFVLNDATEEAYQAFQQKQFPVNVIESFVGTDGALIRITTEEADGTLRYGFLDADGEKLVIPCEYTQTRDVACDRVAVMRDGKWGYLDTAGNVIVAPCYEDAGPFREGLGLAPVKRDGLWGFIDANGAERIAPRYEEIYCANETEINVKKVGKWGLIDADGNEILPMEYETMLFFSEGLAVARQGTQYGYIDRNGTWVIAPQFDTCDAFSGGFALVGNIVHTADSAEVRYALIDSSGAVAQQFEKYTFGPRGFQNGYIAVGFPDYGSKGLLDSAGVEIECGQTMIWP